MKKACEFLLRHQMEDGGWGEDFAVSITCLPNDAWSLNECRANVASNFSMYPYLVLSTRKDYTLPCIYYLYPHSQALHVHLSLAVQILCKFRTASDERAKAWEQGYTIHILFPGSINPAYIVHALFTLS